MSAALDNAELAAALGQHDFRLQGIEAPLVGLLGQQNVRRLIALAAEAANHFLAEGSPSHSELLNCMRVRERLEVIEREALAAKPVLPRLRAEFFRPGDEVVVFVGDTMPTAAFGWVRGRVESVTKSHKPEFSSDRATKGFYWRVVVECEPGNAGAPLRLACSTTEPRVLLAVDFNALLGSFESDLLFLGMYCRNATREWPPIWAIEVGDQNPKPSHAFAQWLLRGSMHPAIRWRRAW